MEARSALVIAEEVSMNFFDILEGLYTLCDSMEENFFYWMLLVYGLVFSYLTENCTSGSILGMLLSLLLIKG